MLLEAAAAGSCSEGFYDVDLDLQTTPWTLDTRSIIRRIASEIAGGKSAVDVARCFHRSVARAIELVCRRVREMTGAEKICLSGGTFQNWTLLSDTLNLLRRGGFQVFIHSQVPPNDGGLSLGQAVIGVAFLQRTNPNVSGDSRQN